ncbi:Cytochrome c-type protein TorC [Serratia fonticola]|uniref:Cytochrome c-type protein TorC n=1 Tax=Serratia fonticola TaxID=47917 RepID=A0A4U9UR36_SERFO|nr:Cytochrome c-type protein TorC [Serratia fonticola]
MAQSVWKTLKENDSAPAVLAIASMPWISPPSVLKPVFSTRWPSSKAKPVSIAIRRCAYPAGYERVPHRRALPNWRKPRRKPLPTATTLFTIATEPFFLKADDTHNAGNLMPSTEVHVVKQEGDKVLVDVSGWQQDASAKYSTPRKVNVSSASAGRRCAQTAENRQHHDDAKPAWSGIRFHCSLVAT